MSFNQNEDTSLSINALSQNAQNSQKHWVKAFQMNKKSFENLNTHDFLWMKIVCIYVIIFTFASSYIYFTKQSKVNPEIESRVQRLEIQMLSYEQRLKSQQQEYKRKEVILSQQLKKEQAQIFEIILKQIYFQNQLNKQQEKSGQLSKQLNDQQRKISELSKWVQEKKIEEKDIYLEIKKNIQYQNNKFFYEKVNKLEELIAKKAQNPLNIIEIQYNYQPLPINPLKGIDGKNIANYLYKDQPNIKSRAEFIQQRISFIDSKQGYPNLLLAKYNFIKNEQMLRQAIDQNERDWLRLQKIFKISSTKEELQFCVVVPSYNNNANFRIEGNLNSIFTQNYTNYKAVIINDASTDKSGQIYKEYFKFYKIDKSKYVYVQNQKRVTALQNIYYASMNQCSKESIIMILDGDDEFIGRNVLKMFNWGIQSKKAGVLYSNFYWYDQAVKLSYGFTQKYTSNQKTKNIYREIQMKFSQLRAFRAQLFHQINVKDLQDQKGVFYGVAYDIAIFFPVMELSCGRVQKLQGEYHYLYNFNTGINDYKVIPATQIKVEKRIRGQKKYECYKQFDQRMKK